MAVLALIEVEGILLGVYFLAAVFLGCILHFVYQTASGVAQRQRASSLPGINDVLCPCIFGRYSTLQFTMGCTVAAVGCFFLTAVTWVVAESTWFVICYDCDKNSDNKRTDSIAGLNAVASFFLGSAYLLLLTAAFERLRLTFSGTVMQLPKWAPKALYAAIFLGYAYYFVIIATISFVHANPIITATCLLLMAFNYFFSLSAVVALFFNNTISLALKSQNPDIRIIDTAVRISICVTVSLVSTCIECVAWIPAQMYCPNCLVFRLLLACGLVFDVCLNAFCLMCTFSQAESHYQRVFGRVHATLRARVLRSKVETKIGECLDAAISASPTNSLASGQSAPTDTDY